MRKDGRTYRHDEANIRFSQILRKRLKRQGNVTPYVAAQSIELDFGFGPQHISRLSDLE
jgi:hypothetical protein